MSRVETSIRIDAPLDTVWEVLMDPERLGDWVTIHRKVGKVSDTPLKEGATLEQTLCLAHTNFNVNWEVTEVREPKLVVWEGKGPVRSHAHTTYRFEPDGNGGTRFRYENDFKPPMGPLGSAAGRVLVGGVSKREAENSLKKLKAILES